MRVFIVSLTLLINFVLQTTVFGYISIVGVKPNTTLVIIIIYAMLRGDVEGALVGFFAGLLQDLFFGDRIGLYALMGAVLGFLCGKPLRDFYREHPLLPMLLVGVGVLCYEFVLYISTFLFLGKVDLPYYFRSIILPETVYTLVFAIPIYQLMYHVNDWLERRYRMTHKFL